MINAFKRAGSEVKFLGYADLLNNSYHESIRMLWSRSKLAREFSSPIWLKKVNEVYLSTSSSYNPDVILSVKGETLLPKYIDKIKKNVNSNIALWFPDDPRFFNSVVKDIAPHYDTIFTYSKNAINLYRSILVDNVYRLPFGCDPYIHKGTLNIQSMKKKRALFIGTFSPKRYRFLKSLIKFGVPLDIIGSKWGSFLSGHVVRDAVTGFEYTKTIQSYPVVINLHQDINYGPNMRTFEVTGSGGVLLSDRAEDITDFFRDNEEIMIYDSIREAAEKIKLMLNDTELLLNFSKLSQERCYKFYTYDQRVKELLNHIK
jgi:spore maturation protein CgeB